MNGLEAFSDPNNDIDRPEERKKKRRKIDGSNSSLHLGWRDEEQRVFTSRLLHVLYHVRRNSPNKPPCNNAIRLAADRILASAARGCSRWSRAILVPSKRNLRLRMVKRRPKKPMRRREEKVVATAVERKTKALGRLVPGCRKSSFGTILEETTDYIKALEMQVRAMTTLVDLLSSVPSEPRRS